MLDVRLPIGWLFIVLGVLLAVYGYANPPEQAIVFNDIKLPLNLDVPWGILMTLFGVVMVSLSKIDSLKTMEDEVKQQGADAT